MSSSCKIPNPARSSVRKKSEEVRLRDLGGHSIGLSLHIECTVSGPWSTVTCF